MTTIAASQPPSPQPKHRQIETKVTEHDSDSETGGALSAVQHIRELKRLARLAHRRAQVIESPSTTKTHIYTNLFGTPETEESEVSNTSWRMNADGLAEPSRSKPRPYLSYMLNTYRNLFLTFYFNWTMIFTAPISSLAFVIVYPTAVVLLFIFEIGLKVFMDYLGGSAFVHYIGSKYGEGLGAINWGAPNLLLSEQTAELVKSTLPSLGKPEPPNKAGGGGVRSRTFDLSIAQTFTVISSVIYERDADKVKSAYEVYANAMKSSIVDLEDQVESPVERKMKCLLWQSERRIRTIVANWGLHFAGVSELKSLGGPFCGIFWSEEHPFIVVAFKGTTPTNYEEFLVDATFQRTDARSYLFGSVHEGFYESVFPTAGFGSDDTRDPYGAILSAVQEKAQQMQARMGTSEPIQVWITGHSLGAAMSSLLFARWLKCPEDLTSRCVLRDAYVIGTPAVGDNDFASYFSSFSNHPVSRTSTLWRIINKHDIICRIPPGYDSQTIGNYMKSTDFFNYSHIGHAIQLNSRWHRKPLRVYPSGYQATMQVEITLGGFDSRCVDYNLPDGQIITAAENPSPSTSTDIDTNTNTHTNIKPKLTSGFVDPRKALVFMQHDDQINPVKFLALPRFAMYISKKAWFRTMANKFTDGNPIHSLESIYPFFFKDHIPVHYFEGLERARSFCYDMEKKDRQIKL
ncbi:Alpha/Beta hydrolase protein [Phycomyces blakesleeanus]|uniref:Fungal lipase-type domain-containing protein n=2 Tax=Phycomyces blakesleeanus TaxID=4837 RepID=A0A167L0H7_PHYB8|nr:hypothetical protein PHYBLDRAFT_182922 [Phycomyces blakesleeanus NRRL 1555(-)]OAD69307.1 hypothetical protein PHYBLDRAFT_182922 [Phycomyces blakesleeanus NRRL 1555(-)]|eukprot:XP_018287347.1 hypothetical protein PHYBLDRAFT_182922 [Phycomyces blakesleeanus NRRL 1555(-)]